MRAGITFFVSGCILIVFGMTMAFPALLDFSDSNTDSARAFAQSAGVTLFFGALFVTTFYDKYEKLSVREMYLTTSLVWLLVCCFSALPFYFSPVPLDYTDAFFEAMSGLTTMGATVIGDLSTQPRGILLWRAMLHWFGGAGIIVIALGILPLLRIGGMQLYAMESSDKSDKSLPKTSQIIAMIMGIYTVLTVPCRSDGKLPSVTSTVTHTSPVSSIPTSHGMTLYNHFLSSTFITCIVHSKKFHIPFYSIFFHTLSQQISPV